MKQQLKNIIELSTPIFDYDNRVKGININYIKSSGVHEGGAIPVDNTGKYIDLGLSFTDEISFFRKINDALSDFFSNDNIFNQDNTFQLSINKDLTYSFKHFFDSSLDPSREAETRAAIGNELYDRFEQENKNFQPVEEESTSPSLLEMDIDQLLGFIHQKLGEELEDKNINWNSLVLNTTIKLGESAIEKSIETSFYYISLSSEKKVEFEPENSIGAMNAISQIRDKMIKEGKVWNTSEVTIHHNGEVNFQF